MRDSSFTPDKEAPHEARRAYEAALAIAKKTVRESGIRAPQDKKLILSGGREHDHWLFNLTAYVPQTDRTGLRTDANDPGTELIAQVIVRDRADNGEIVRPNKIS